MPRKAPLRSTTSPMCTPARARRLSSPALAWIRWAARTALTGPSKTAMSSSPVWSTNDRQLAANPHCKRVATRGARSDRSSASLVSPSRVEYRAQPLACPRLLLRLLGLPLLFQSPLSRLLFHALLRVLVLGRHVSDLLLGAGETSADVHHLGRLRNRFMCVAALPDASWRFHLRRLQPHSVRGLDRSLSV